MLMPEITYYEHEINNSIFEGNKCKEYIELMERFLRGEGYSSRPSESVDDRYDPPYNDPDNWLEGCSYFWELTQFLNKREIWLKEKMEEMGKTYQPYRYIAPNNCKRPEKVKREQGSDKNEIIVKDDNNKEKFRLKSDQFGFLVGVGKKDFDSHPYGYLCELVEKKTENWDKKEAKKEKERVYKVIAECIYHTRTLGGGFLWGKAIWDKYNKGRGGSKNTWTWKNRKDGENRQYYIEDRVDLTLLEIKHLFDWIERRCMDEKELLEAIRQGKGYEYTDDILWCTIKENAEKSEVSEYIQWLKRFGTFEKFIQFFCFDDFVDSKYKTWMPLDIMKSKLEWDDKHKILSWEKVVFLEDPTKYKQCEEYSIYHLDRTVADLEQMLINVSSLALARSYRMQEVLDGIAD